MFDDDEIRRSHRSEYIPIDSTEACEDVERFFRSGFETMRKEFRHSVHGDWPSDTDFLKLTAASSGLFIYAQVVTEFIRDSAHADPVSRFEVLLSVIDRSNAIPTNENPFVHLDALYHEILSSIPSTQWPTAKRLLALTIHAEYVNFLRDRGYFKTFRGMSLLFGIPRHVMYACLNKCRSTLKLPDWKVAHKQNLIFLHASFADYLKDSRRSGEFYVGELRDVEQNVELRVLEIWNECSSDNIAPESVRSTWDQYCAKLDTKAPSKEISKIHAHIFRDMALFAQSLLSRIFQTLRVGSSETQMEPILYAQVCKIHIVNLFYCLDVHQLVDCLSWLRPPVLRLCQGDTGFLRVIELSHLKLGHLDRKEMLPTRASYGKNGKASKEAHWILHRPCSSAAELNAFVSELESFRDSSPKHQVFVFGGIPKGRVAAVCLLDNSLNSKYYVIPYPE